MFNAQAIKWGTRLSKQLHAALYLHTGGLSQAFPTSAKEDKAPAVWGIYHSFIPVFNTHGGSPARQWESKDWRNPGS